MKCSKHPDKDAAAMCDRCNLFYCGTCALSSNGKCPACGNTLRSPENVLSFEINPEELYKGKGQPRIIEAIYSLHIEPVRTMKRLKEYASFITAFFNVTVWYSIVTFLRIALMFGVVALLAPTEMSNTLDTKTLFAILISTIYGFGITLVVWIASSFIFYLPARSLGGKGTFMQQAYMLSYIMLALLPLSIFALLMLLVPAVGILLTVLVGVLIALYGLFLQFLSTRDIHSFKNITTAISLVISLVIGSVLGLLVSLFLAALTIFAIGGKLLPLSI